MRFSVRIANPAPGGYHRLGDRRATKLLDAGRAILQADGSLLLTRETEPTPAQITGLHYDAISRPMTLDEIPQIPVCGRVRTNPPVPM